MSEPAVLGIGRFTFQGIEGDTSTSQGGCPPFVEACVKCGSVAGSCDPECTSTSGGVSVVHHSDFDSPAEVEDGLRLPCADSPRFPIYGSGDVKELGAEDLDEEVVQAESHDLFGVPFVRVSGMTWAPKCCIADALGADSALRMADSALRKMRSTWSPRSGDVILASKFPLRGLQRMLVTLVENRKDPWAQGLLDRPYLIEAGASRRGVDEYLEQIASWPGRRCFKTHCLPQNLPCRWPLKTPKEEGGIAPKVVVLVADPRYALTIFWEVMTRKGSQPIPMSAFIEAVTDKRFQWLGDYFGHALAWAREAQKSPDTVRLFVAERFASCDPGQVKSACRELAEFVEAPNPHEAAERLVTATFRRPPDASIALASDTILSPEAINGGPLVELLGPRLLNFEQGLAEVSQRVQTAFRRLLFSWEDGSDPCLLRLARVASGGVASLPPAALMRPMRGEAAHMARECRPCVFNLRGACRNTAEMCVYCHEIGHQRTKRASRSKRTARRLRASTPSIDGLST